MQPVGTAVDDRTSQTLLRPRRLALLGTSGERGFFRHVCVFVLLKAERHARIDRLVVGEDFMSLDQWRITLSRTIE